MTGPEQTLWSWRAARLRQTFDDSFAAPEAGVRLSLTVLDVRVGPIRCAIPLSTCAGIAASAAIATAPSRVRGFRGFTSAGGVVRPVYELADRLGLSSSPERRPPLLFARAHAVAFAVSAIEGQVDVEDGHADERDGIRFVPLPHGPARLVSLDAMLDDIARAVRASAGQSLGGE